MQAMKSNPNAIAVSRNLFMLTLHPAMMAATNLRSLFWPRKLLNRA
jgi:hypothetical protein